MCNIFRKKIKGEADLKCPRCGIRMKKINKAEVIIDVCSRCRGMWLDDNEIEKLIGISKEVKDGKGKKR